MTKDKLPGVVVATVKEIFTCKEYSIFRHLPDNPVAGIRVICFDEIKGGLNRSGFGISFLIKNNIDSFFVSHSKKSFFQGLSEKSLLNHLLPYLKGAEVFTFGASLGGYAAIYYSDVLNARAISFSPRCSVDTIYKDSKNIGVTFKHQALSQKKLTGNLAPVVVVDPKVAKDKKFLDSRILPLYNDNINLIELPGSSHYTARAMSSQDLLKDFVLNIIFKNTVNSVEIDVDNNAISLSAMAVFSAKKGRYSDSNKYLEKLLLVGKLPNGVMRLNAYLILSEAGELAHHFDKSNIFPSEKKAMYNHLFSQVKNSKKPEDMLLVQAETHIKLLEFWKAIEVLNEVKELYPRTERIDEVLERAKKLYSRTEQWLS